MNRILQALSDDDLCINPRHTEEAVNTGKLLRNYMKQQKSLTGSCSMSEANKSHTYQSNPPLTHTICTELVG